MAFLTQVLTSITNLAVFADILAGIAGLANCFTSSLARIAGLAADFAGFLTGITSLAADLASSLTSCLTGSLTSCLAGSLAGCFTSGLTGVTCLAAYLAPGLAVVADITGLTVGLAGVLTSIASLAA